MYLPHACGDEPLGFRDPANHRLHLPHACGDEPINRAIFRWFYFICPTHVGMNRLSIFFPPIL